MGFEGSDNEMEDTDRDVREAKTPAQLIDSGQIVVLVSPETGATVYLIGTSHLSGTSASATRELILREKPDYVVVELDGDRFQELLNPSRPQLVRSLIAGMRQRSAWQVLRSIGDGSFVPRSGRVAYAFMSAVVGSPAGGEFVAAIDAAREVGAEVICGDRDIKVTLARLSVACSRQVWRCAGGKGKPCGLPDHRLLYQGGSAHDEDGEDTTDNARSLDPVAVDAKVDNFLAAAKAAASAGGWPHAQDAGEQVEGTVPPLDDKHKNGTTVPKGNARVAESLLDDGAAAEAGEWGGGERSREERGRGKFVGEGRGDARVDVGDGGDGGGVQGSGVDWERDGESDVFGQLLDDVPAASFPDGASGDARGLDSLDAPGRQRSGFGGHRQESSRDQQGSLDNRSQKDGGVRNGGDGAGVFDRIGRMVGQPSRGQFVWLAREAGCDDPEGVIEAAKRVLSCGINGKDFSVQDLLALRRCGQQAVDNLRNGLTRPAPRVSSAARDGPDPTTAESGHMAGGGNGLNTDAENRTDEDSGDDVFNNKASAGGRSNGAGKGPGHATAGAGTRGPEGQDQTFMEQLRREFPALDQVLVHERDLILAQNVQLAGKSRWGDIRAGKVSSSYAKGDIVEPYKVVGVVGAGHLAGMQRLWGEACSPANLELTAREYLKMPELGQPQRRPVNVLPPLAVMAGLGAAAYYRPRLMATVVGTGAVLATGCLAFCCVSVAGFERTLGNISAAFHEKLDD